MRISDIEQGHFIKVKVPHVEEPIKAVVLDITITDVIPSGHRAYLICYAQKRVFKVSYKYFSSIKLNAMGNPYKWESTPEYSYEGIIIEYCEIPRMPTDI